MLNSISMVGRLTRDPELKQTQSGNQVGSFAIACDDKPGPNGEKQVVFINCSIFGKGADVLVKFFRKGNLIGIVGRLTQRKYQNRDGVEVTSTEILVNQIEFVESAKDREAQQPAQPAQAAAPAAPVVTGKPLDVQDEDLPF